MHLLPKEWVIEREKRRKASNGRGGGKATANSYVATIENLRRQQKRMKINSYPSPRDDSVTALLAITMVEENNARRKTIDKSRSDTLRDGYTTTEKIQRIAKYFGTASRDAGIASRVFALTQRSYAR
ncbi:hypothetical protein GN958_ATG15501 [Phytophthora infestans]|uniref:Uncharacterized protein n=1 Tax=Phytophthora infestans TaxID=4787 RepID=A0A8S9U4Y8_PHYIN|nr:hypothetical protein GN958_ATG15501 [Phytophthora infestans]